MAVKHGMHVLLGLGRSNCATMQCLGLDRGNLKDMQ